MNYNEIIDQHVSDFYALSDKYKTLSKVGKPIQRPSAPIMGRDMNDFRLAIRNPEKSNVIVLGEPGSGKTAFMQGFAYDKDSTQYLVVAIDIERLVTGDNKNVDAEMANGLLDLVADTKRYSVDNDLIVVLFIDEFHRIAMLSPSSVEALKPILEKSAYNGFRIVAATTFEEYDEWIGPNRALDQRLLRMSIPELDREAVIGILKSRADKYNVGHLADPKVFEEIYDVSKQILISNSQPRASIDILMTMIGNITKHEYMKNGQRIFEYATAEELDIASEYPLSRPILNKVIARSYGIDIDNKVSISAIKQRLAENILDQDMAINQISSSLEMILNGFVDTTRPKYSFLSMGPTGVGKAICNDEKVPTPDGWRLHGSLNVGDNVYGHDGREIEVLEVYPQGEIRLCRVFFEDGRSVRCSYDHLWQLDDGVVKIAKDLKIGDVIPQPDAINFDEKDVIIDPYVVGCLIATNQLKTLSSDYLYGSIYQRVRLLEGIFDIVGDVYYGIFEDEIKQIIYSLGLSVTHDEMRVAKVVDDGVGEASCILVNDPSHLYLVGDYVVTHNTELAKQLCEGLNIPMKRFDMSRYSRPEDAIAFANDLSQAALFAPNGYLLIDEVEKSCREVINILLQVLDDARLTAANNPNRVISFTGNIINLTTNVGSHVFDEMKKVGRMDQAVDEKLIYRSLSDDPRFETAVLGRVDNIIPFVALKDKTMSKIVRKYLDTSMSVVETARRRILISEEIIPFIVRDQASRDAEQGGARDAKRVTKQKVIQPLAHHLSVTNKECPLVVALDGVARFKHRDVGDTSLAHVVILECHDFKVISNLVARLNAKRGYRLDGSYVFVPLSVELSDFITQINRLGAQGVTKIKTVLDYTNATFVADN